MCNLFRARCLALLDCNPQPDGCFPRTTILSQAHIRSLCCPTTTGGDDSGKTQELSGARFARVATGASLRTPGCSRLSAWRLKDSPEPNPEQRMTFSFPA